LDALPEAQLEAKRRLAEKGQLAAHRPHGKKLNSTVCVSLPVFEDPEYIEELLANFMKFTESTTKVALHFEADDSNVHYDTERIASFASDRVAVTKRRIEIRKIGGSILFAHVLNAKTLEERWPGECDLFVMQASNMWWVRPGMENAVREHRYAQLAVQPHSLAANSGPFWHELEPKALNGWGQPEGAYFPMKMVHDFNAYMDGWLEKTHQKDSAVLDVRIYIEAFWLPTYALNFATDLPEESVGGDFSLCYRHMVEVAANYDKDSVPIEEVKDLIAGKEFIHNVVSGKDVRSAQYFAVKRVNRDLHHPTTQFIVSLAH
jgi:hypothetical protein